MGRKCQQALAAARTQADQLANSQGGQVTISVQYTLQVAKVLNQTPEGQKLAKQLYNLSRQPEIHKPN
jgi:hypothetical protein